MRVLVFGMLERQVACQQCGHCDAAARMQHFAGDACVCLPSSQFGVPLHFCSAQCTRTGVAQLAARADAASGASDASDASGARTDTSMEPRVLRTTRHHMKRRRLW